LRTSASLCGERLADARGWWDAQGEYLAIAVAEDAAKQR